MSATNKTRWWSRFVLTGMLLGLIIPLFGVGITEGIASAQSNSCTWASTTSLNCGGQVFTGQASGNNMTFGVNGGSCAQIVLDNYKTNTTGIFTPGTMSGIQFHTSTCSAGGAQSKITISQSYNAYVAAQAASSSSSSSTGSNAPSPQLSCTLNIFNPLTWLICPLVSAAQGAIEGLTSGIDSLLTINTCELFSVNQSCGATVTASEKADSLGFYKAWNTFRIFAAALIVIAGLIMLIAQASGASFIDAYTIHKLLPRVLIAVIFITLSWPLLNFAITLTNDLGTGIRAIIYQPFESIGTTVTVGGGAATVGALVGTATFLTLGLLGIASFMLTALLAVFVGFLVLFLRQVVVMMLVIFAPLAIACYVLPGTQKAWGFWKDTFLSMLIVFPIISAMIAMGRVFSVVMYNNRTGGVPVFVNEIGAFIVYFLPYFLLPAAFRWAGGAMATIGGLVNDRHRGAFDRLKGFRKNQAASRYERAHEGNLYHGSNRVAKGVNMLAWGGTNLNKAGYNPRKWNSKMHESHEIQAYDEAREMLEKSPELRAIANDNAALKATRMMAGGKSRKEIESWLTDKNGGGLKAGSDELRNTMTRAEMVAKSGPNKAVQIATLMADATSGTGWQHDEGALEAGNVGTAFEKYAADVSEVAGGDKNLAMRVYGDTRAAMARSRPEMAGQGFMAGWEQIQGQMGGTKADGKAVAMDAFMHTDAGTIFRSKDYAQQALMTVASQEASRQAGTTNNGVDPKLKVQIGDLTAGLANAQRSGIYASPQAVKILRETIDKSPEIRTEVESAMSRQQGGPVPEGQGGRPEPPEGP
jgi:hypothetical protein